MKNINAKERHTIVFFDLRNFSEHRSRLADEGRARLLTKFVKDILDTAVELLEASRNQFEMVPAPILDHTGDGFMLILRGDRNPLLGFLWMSEFRREVLLKIKDYQETIRGIFQDNPPKKLGFGIGAHYGLALPFRFKIFGSQLEAEGFIGSALNIASRVEQCTKDHVHQILFTENLLKSVLKIIPKGHKTPISTPNKTERLALEIESQFCFPHNMLQIIAQMLDELHAVFILLLGAMIGILGSVIIWHKQTREERRRKRAELLLQVIELTYSTGTHTRCLIYSKMDGIKGVLKLPENPVDKIMSIVLIHFPEARTHVQALHEQQQDLFG